MSLLKQSTAYTVLFKMIDSADHLAKKTGLTCAVSLSKAGGTFAAAGGTVTEVANGWYKIALTTTDTNTLGDLAYYITAAGADDTDFRDQVVPYSFDNLDAAISSRGTSTYAGGDTSGTTTLLNRIAGSLTITGGKVDVNDKTGFALSSAAVQAIWDALTSALTTVGSIGKLIVTNLDAAISTRMATFTYTAPTVPPTVVQVRQEMDSNSTKLANLDAAVSSRGTSNYAGGAVASVTAAVTVGTNNDKTGYSIAGTKTNLDALQDISAANVLTQVNSALDATSSELATMPAVSASVRQQLRLLFQYFKGKKTVTATTETLFKSDGATPLGTAALTDTGTTFTKENLS